VVGADPSRHAGCRAIRERKARHLMGDKSPKQKNKQQQQKQHEKAQKAERRRPGGPAPGGAELPKDKK
jgi:hypothetical protein